VTDVQPLVLHCSDGIELEGEWAPPDGTPLGTVVLCHPHPQYGGTMRSIVISALFGALPAAGYGCLRFNFRGVEGSQGEHGAGETEPTDVLAAIDTATGYGIAGVLAVVGWSFGGDMALSIDDPRVDGWIGIAPPLRFGSRLGTVANDPRPKHLVLAQHDEFRTPAGVQEEVASWTNTTTEVVPGASHFFVGRTDRVIDATMTFLGQLAGKSPKPS
jgi:alpha/beta superfamily hydrolase